MNNLHPQVTTLLSEIFRSRAKAAYKLRSVSYGSKHASSSVSNTPFYAYFYYIHFMLSSKTTGHIKMSIYWMTALLWKICTCIFGVKVVCEVWLAGFGSKHALQSLWFTTGMYLHTKVENYTRGWEQGGRGATASPINEWCRACPPPPIHDEGTNVKSALILSEYLGISLIIKRYGSTS